MKPDSSDQSSANPMQHPEEQPGGAGGNPKFGRLLAILACAVAIIIAITFASAAWFGL